MTEGYKAVCPLCGYESISESVSRAKHGVKSHMAKSFKHPSIGWDNLPEIEKIEKVTFCSRCRGEKEKSELVKVRFMDTSETEDFCEDCWESCDHKFYNKVSEGVQT